MIARMFILSDLGSNELELALAFLSKALLGIGGRNRGRDRRKKDEVGGGARLYRNSIEA